MSGRRPIRVRAGGLLPIGVPEGMSMSVHESRLYLVHSSADRRFTRRLARDLRAQGRDVWFAQWTLLDRALRFEEIIERLPDGFALGIVLSPASRRAACLQGPAPAKLGLEFARRGIFALLIRHAAADDGDANGGRDDRVAGDRDAEADAALPAALVALPCADFRSEYTRGLDTLFAHLEQSVPQRCISSAPPAMARPVATEATGDHERSYFEHILRQCKGDITQAARVAGMDSETFHSALRRAGVDPLKFRS